MPQSIHHHRYQRRDHSGAAPGPGRVRRLDHEAARIRRRARAHGRRTRGLGLHADARWRRRRADPQDASPRSMSARTIDDRERTYRTAWRRSLASHCAGVGLRALSIVDLAGVGHRRARSPTSRSPSFSAATTAADAGDRDHRLSPGDDGAGEDRRAGARALAQAGWRRFKAPMAATLETRGRAPSGRTRGGARCVARLRRRVDVRRRRRRPPRSPTRSPTSNLGWFEDVFPPGDALQLAELRKRVADADRHGRRTGRLLLSRRRSSWRSRSIVVRIDLTCMGGITGGRRIVDECLQAGVDFSPHMFAHVHSQVFSGWGFAGLPDRMGRAVDGRRSLCRQPGAAGDRRRRADAAAAAGPGFGQ